MARLEGEKSLLRPGFGHRHPSEQMWCLSQEDLPLGKAGLIPSLAVYMRRYTPGAMHMGGVYWIPHSDFIALSTKY